MTSFIRRHLFELGAECTLEDAYETSGRRKYMLVIHVVDMILLDRVLAPPDGYDAIAEAKIS